MQSYKGHQGRYQLVKKNEKYLVNVKEIINKYKHIPHTYNKKINKTPTIDDTHSHFNDTLYNTYHNTSDDIETHCSIHRVVKVIIDTHTSRSKSTNIHNTNLYEKNTTMMNIRCTALVYPKTIILVIIIYKLKYKHQEVDPTRGHTHRIHTTGETQVYKGKFILTPDANTQYNRLPVETEHDCAYLDEQTITTTPKK